MKIIIIGAGISGLSSYILLKKHLPHEEDLSIHIYEAYDVRKLKPNVTPLSEAGSNDPIFTPVAIGNAIGIGKNGLQVLRRMSEDGRIMKQAVRRGNPITAWRMSNARGWTLAYANMVAKAHDDNTNLETLVSEDTASLMIARQDLWEIIRDEVLRDGDVVSTKRVINIDIGDSSKKSIIAFDDGTSDTADLVIGADGLRSALRGAMFQVESGRRANDKVPSSSAKELLQAPDYITPRYEGLGGVGGFIATKELQQDSNFDPKVMNIVFGPNGFFGYGCIASSSASTITANSLQEVSTDTANKASDASTVSFWWSTFSSPNPYPYRHELPPPNSSSSTKPTYIFDSTTAIQDLQTRHKNWHNPTIQRILRSTTKTGLTTHQYFPTWTTPTLPTSHKNGTAVLIGDAAHALQTSSGQGASQALEDAEALSLLLKHYLTKHKQKQEQGDRENFTQNDVVKIALAKFEELRKPRVQMIHAHSQKTGMAKKDMGFFMEMVMYFFIWLFSFLHDGYNDKVMNYDLPRDVQRIIKED